MSTFVIVGAALAGAKAAEALRSEGFDGRIALIGAEAERPYERPPLSKDLLRGESEVEGARVHEPGFYEEKDIELRTGVTVEAIDTGAGEVALAGGERLAYDRLLLTTGAEPRRLPVPGADLEGVHYLRDLADSAALGERIAAGGRLVVIGAGWIGSEVAASARQKGCDVAIVEMTDVPLERVLGREVGAIYGDIHRDHGVELHSGVGVQAIEGDGRAERVRLSDGRALDCDFVVVGVGVVPRTALAEQAGIAVNDGIVVDEHLQTSVPGIYAAGDVANAFHPFFGHHLRVEHWANALNQPATAAQSMLGKEATYERLPYFFSDQYEVGMEYTGFARDWDEVVTVGDVAAREFVAFWLREGRLLAGMNVNVWDVTERIQEMIRSRRQVSRDELASYGSDGASTISSPSSVT
jgi:3-phenylpropionate/trans-cinnamate dioxygenase ferredoxin reductase component